MSSRRAGLAIVGAALLVSGPTPALRVFRTSPSETATPSTPVAVTFDRPVAGSLDYSIDPHTILRIAPGAPGRIEWRDPVTIEFTPSEPLRSGTHYTVTVANDFHAMDGAALEQPYSFSFRVRGPTLLAGDPVQSARQAEQLTATNVFRLVYSAPVSLARLTTTAYVQFGPLCGGRVVRLRATAQRPVAKDDMEHLREAGGWQRNRAEDSLRRVVTLTPAEAMPLDCGGELVAPTEIDSTTDALTRWSFATHGRFALDSVRCEERDFCPTGQAVAFFKTPVRGAEVLRHLRLMPETKFAIADTAEESTRWVLDARLAPHTTYAAVVDTSIRDIFAQPLTGNPAAAFRTTGYEPTVEYMHGKIVAERRGNRALALQFVNVDTIVAFVAAVPDSLEARFLSGQEYGWRELWSAVSHGADVRRMAVHAHQDRGAIASLPLPVMDARVKGAPTLFAIKVVDARRPTDAVAGAPIALVQLTNLGIHARVGVEEAAVWVTGVDDGLPREGAVVTVKDADGRSLGSARTGASGLAYLTGFHRQPPTSPRHDAEDEDDDGDANSASPSVQGYVSAVLGDDRAVVSVSEYDPDLSPWRLGVFAASGERRVPAAGAVFTERGIYRPGESVYAKAIVRTGNLGALRTPSGDSLRWELTDREGARVHETTAPLNEFGTASLTLPIPAGAAIGRYQLVVRRNVDGVWRELARTSYRVAEYRPPEFLVDVGTGADSVSFPGDTVRASVQARYLFGAPMGRAAVTWRAESRPSYGGGGSIPKMDDWYIGESGAWWEDGEYGDGDEAATVVASGIDTLDASGRLRLRVPVPADPKGRASTLTITAGVTDVNRQAVAATTYTVVHPASFYLAAKSLGAGYFWSVGAPARVGVLAVRPDGRRVAGVKVTGTVVRREWHQVRRERDGSSELVGEWVSDTVARCRLTTTTEAATCGVTPAAGGAYIVRLDAVDERGRHATTSFYRWTVGREWVPWNDESQFKMDVIADRTRYSVGDTATILFASPFTGAEAWVTIEREGVLEQRRMRIESGTTTLKLPILEAYAPNVFVSILVARGRSAPPSGMDDAGRPTIRVGYAQLRVTPEIKRLTVDLKPLAVEYRPGDSARVQLAVRDKAGAGQRAEVTLWAVDEGVLALTDYTTPDPLDLLYNERGIGMRLASNMVAVAPQLPEGEKGRRSPGGGGGLEGADILRTQFRSTAFFLASVVTDPSGHAQVAAKLPDNLTTFRLMAVAVTASDRYGSGHAPMLVTRPLVARPALPRFTRPGDQFLAGTVINQRAGGTPTVQVKASARGASLGGAAEQRATLEAGRGREVRFDFRTTAEAGDSAAFRFAVSGAGDADAVERRLPVMATYHPRAHTIAGVVRDTATAELRVPAGTDLARSKLTLSFGASPAVVLRGLYHAMRVYEYDCTEQVTSEALPLLAIARSSSGLSSASLRTEIARAVAVIRRRQRTDGGIGYWGPDDWTTPWLSAYAGGMLLDARTAGVPVDSALVSRLGDYLSGALKSDSGLRAPVLTWYANRHPFLGEQVAAADFLSRAGRADRAAENELFRVAAMMNWETRVRLAEVLARRASTRPQARQLLAGTWSAVKLVGRRAILPDSSHAEFYFPSRVRPAARLLAATLAVDSVHPLIGPLVETVLAELRGNDGWWNTQDVGAAAGALAAFELRQRRAVARGLRVRSGGRLLLQTSAELRDTSVALTGLVAERADGEASRLTLTLEGAPDETAYYSLTVSEIPRAAPVRPDDQGIAVERWYERFETGKPVTSVTEGELVRVRLRITVPDERRFVVLDDALPAGLEAVDLSLRTSSPLAGPGAGARAIAADAGGSDDEDNSGDDTGGGQTWGYGMWDAGWWSPFDHRELRDDRVVYFATLLWKGTYTASYIARATTAGTFVRPPAIAEEMYNPAVQGRSDGGTFRVVPRGTERAQISERK